MSRLLKVGDIFESWKVIGYDKEKARNICMCMCGNVSRVHTSTLISGRSKRCNDCSGNKLKNGVAGFNRKLRTVKRQAEKRNLEWKLTSEEAKMLFLGNCNYCNAMPNQRVFSDSEEKTPNSLFICNGIDRVDNTKGYIKENCVSCCKVCNRAKDNLTSYEFISLAYKIIGNVGFKNFTANV